MGLTEATADLLKTPSGDTCDEDILAYLFNSRDQALIKQTLPSNSPPHDQWQWHHDMKGLYTVKSGNRQLTLFQPSFAIYESNNGLKKSLSLSIPPKVKLFMWSACFNLLPTMEALHVRRVTENNRCPRCHRGMENPLHALVLCRSANIACKKRKSCSLHGGRNWLQPRRWSNIISSLCGDVLDDMEGSK